MEGDKEKLKFEALLREYSEIRQENRTYGILQIVCISISVLIFIIMFIASIYSSQYILLFIAPLFSIFFVLLVMGMQAYITILGLRASQVEGLLKDMIGEPTVQFEATVGLFVGSDGDLLTAGVGRYWITISLLVIVIGAAPILISLWYGFIEFYGMVGYFAWFLTGFDAVAVLVTVYVGYRFFFRRGWEKFKLAL